MVPKKQMRYLKSNKYEKTDSFAAINLKKRGISSGFTLPNSEGLKNGCDWLIRNRYMHACRRRKLIKNGFFCSLGMFFYSLSLFLSTRIQEEVNGVPIRRSGNIRKHYLSFEVHLCHKFSLNSF